jgi:hypothetical protein
VVCCGSNLGFFWLHASLSGDGVRLSLCTGKQFKLDSFFATNRTAMVATVEHFWGKFFCPDEKLCNRPDNKPAEDALRLEESLMM